MRKVFAWLFCLLLTPVLIAGLIYGYGWQYVPMRDRALKAEAQVAADVLAAQKVSDAEKNGRAGLEALCQANGAAGRIAGRTIAEILARPAPAPGQARSPVGSADISRMIGPE